jgi:hypothetical protein
MRKGVQAQCSIPNKTCGMHYLTWFSAVANITVVRDCCGGNSRGRFHCHSPTNDTFSAPAPSDLKTSYQAGVGPASTDGPPPFPPGARPTGPPPGPPPLTITTSGLIIVTAAPSTPSLTPDSSKFSAGIAAGVGAGVSVAVIFLAVLLFWMYKRKKAQKSGATELDNTAVDHSTLSHSRRSGEDARLMVPEYEYRKPNTSDSRASEIQGRPIMELSAIEKGNSEIIPAHELSSEEGPPQGSQHSESSK